MPGPTVYHYCPATYLDPIRDSGELRPSAAGGKRRERPAVWFTFRETYDPIATKLVQEPSGVVRRQTIEQMAARFGLGRIAVPESVAPVTFGLWARTSGVPKGEARRMARQAKGEGSDVSLYRASYDPIPASEWTAVEVWRGDGWEPA